MYEELKGIDYVMYINKNTNKLTMLDLDSNRNETVHNTGESWNDAAYGNCLISLNHAKSTDALYLLSKNKVKDIRVNVKDLKEVDRVLRLNAECVVERCD